MCKSCFVKRILPLLVLVLSVFSLQAQDYPYVLPHYNFIQYDKNKIDYIPNENYFDGIFEKLNTLWLTGKGKVNIVHIGDSHIQADILTGRIRTRMQNFIPGAYGGQGYVFPYRLIHSNNPINYYVRAKGKWLGKPNIKSHSHLQMGVGGIAAKTSDVHALVSVFIRQKNNKLQKFDKITVFFPSDSTNFDIELKGVQISSVTRFNKDGYVIFYLREPVEHFSLHLIKNKGYQNHFTLDGFSLETAYSGITYSAMGINGAEVASWLTCHLLEKQLRAFEPDMFVVSLGTNDAYTSDFDSAGFALNYKLFIHDLQKAFPGVPIIATTPGDHYLYRRYLNFNTLKVVKTINTLAPEMNFSVWNFNQIMGGLNSILLWQKNLLARRDRVHYSQQGYMLQGDLFFNAFLKEWDKFVDEKNQISGAAANDASLINGL